MTSAIVSYRFGRAEHVRLSGFADSHAQPHMITIEQIDSVGPALGKECRFITRGGSSAAVEYFLEHDGVLYPRALPAEPDGSVRIYPEAPGRYVLVAFLRSPAGHESARMEFEIDGAHDPMPRRVKIAGHRLWAPTAWDAQLLSQHERLLMLALEKVVRRGATIYDIGANIGLFSVAFTEWIGKDGWLYAIEPNPACVSLLRANLAAVRGRNYTILPTAVSDRHGGFEFTLNYGNSLLGLLTNAQHEIVKAGHHVRIDADRLDQLIATFGLRKPDVIKLDVEGAEAQAVAGMMETLAAHRPIVVIELHGLESATATLRLLTRLGYKYSVPSKVATDVTAEALIGCLPDECVQIIGHP